MIEAVYLHLYILIDLSILLVDGVVVAKNI